MNSLRAHLYASPPCDMYVSHDEAMDTAFSVSSLLCSDDELESSDARLLLRIRFSVSVDVLLTNGLYETRPDIAFTSCIDSQGELNTEPAVTNVSESESEKNYFADFN